VGKKERGARWVHRDGKVEGWKDIWGEHGVVMKMRRSQEKRIEQFARSRLSGRTGGL
jgi:hypothetical protein